MNVADMMTPEGIASYQDVCKLREAPNRVLQYNINVVQAAVHNLLRDFDNKVLNDKLTDVPLLDRKYTLLATSGNQQIKHAEPCSIGFRKRKLNFSVGKKHMVLE